MSNTSATGGALLSTTSVLQDDAFLNFLQAALVALTELPTNNVRPLWAPNPLPTPDIAVTWLAFGVVDVKTLGTLHVGESNGMVQPTQRHQSFKLRCVVYGAAANAVISALLDGVEIPQNREAFRAVGVTFGGGEVVARTTPELINERWYYRVDVDIPMAREINRTYPVLSFVSASGIIDTETRQYPFAVNPPA